MNEYYADAKPKENQFWSQEIERINIRTMLAKLTETGSFASRLF